MPVDATKPTIKSATLSKDGLSLRLVIDGLVEGHIHELHLPGIRSAKGQPLLHPAAQAFHWFEPVATRREFLRILKPRGWLIVIWNDRRISETPFGRAYEDLLVRYGTDYASVKEAYPETQDMENFFGKANSQRRELPNFQEFDFDGLAGRLRSSSYAPKENHANYAPMMAALRELFDANQKIGRVRMDYTTQIYFGQLDAKRKSA